jgi:hypothetical protein
VPYSFIVASKFNKIRGRRKGGDVDNNNNGRRTQSFSLYLITTQ